LEHSRPYFRLENGFPTEMSDTNKTWIKVVIVEDDPDDQVIITRAFAQVAPHCYISCLEDSRMLLGLLGSLSDEELPCLIVLDYNMPFLNGLETLKILELDQRYDKIPKIIYSSSSGNLNMDLCYSANAKAWIRKGISTDEIYENVREMLGYV
jgi:CheY-like chemotaxis protein